MTASSSNDSTAAELDASLRASLRAVMWAHRESLDTLRDAICAYAVDLHGKGMSAAQIATTLREVVAELRASGEELSAELDASDPTLDETVRWCLEFGVGPESRSQQGDHGGADWNSSRLECRGK